MCGNHLGLVRDPQVAQLVNGMLHDIPVTVAAHHHPDTGLFCLHRFHLRLCQHPPMTPCKMKRAEKRSIMPNHTGCFTIPARNRMMRNEDHNVYNKRLKAKVAELVDALDLGSSGETRESSSLSFRTRIESFTRK